MEPDKEPQATLTKEEIGSGKECAIEAGAQKDDSKCADADAKTCTEAEKAEDEECAEDEEKCADKKDKSSCSES